MAPRVTLSRPTDPDAFEQQLQEWRETVPDNDWDTTSVRPEQLDNWVTQNGVEWLAGILDVESLVRGVYSHGAFSDLRGAANMFYHVEMAIKPDPLDESRVTTIAEKYIFSPNSLYALIIPSGDQKKTNEVNSIRLLLSHLVEHATKYRLNWTREQAVWAQGMARLIKVKAFPLLKMAVDATNQGFFVAHAKCLELMHRSEKAVELSGRNSNLMRAHNELAQCLITIDNFAKTDYPRSGFRAVRMALNSFCAAATDSGGDFGSVRFLIHSAPTTDQERARRHQALNRLHTISGRREGGLQCVADAHNLVQHGFRVILKED